MTTVSDDYSHRDSKRPRDKNVDSTDLTQMANFPPEIIFEILSRLPVKSLLRFRCVCKSWRSLISDTHFIKKHLNIHVLSTSTTENQRLIFSCSDRKMSFKSCSIYSLFNEPFVDAIEFDYPLRRKRRSDWLIGTCNGLICIGSRKDIVHLWNPSTKETRDLPELGLQRIGRRIGPVGYFVVYGFGYDYSIDDYKVVSIFCYVGHGGSYETQVKVYSIRTNCWRSIKEFPYGAPGDQSGKFVSGALHWQVQFNGRAGGGAGDTNSLLKIVAFDLTSETYWEVPQPMHQGYVGGEVFGVLGGNLCILGHYSESHADVWVMEEYGVRESWNKMFTIPYAGDVRSGWFSYTPFCYSKNGEVLFENRWHMVVYNSKYITFRHPEIHNIDNFYEVDIYVESLVSPYPTYRNEMNTIL